MNKTAPNRRGKLVNVAIPAPWLDALDQLVQEKEYPNRSAAVRDAIRDLLKLHGKRGAQ
ncbi:MAG TPA: ribbon-helix-helix domain-containing protein [Candidatus Bathyarchaeia archaeon]|jgi:Arc/MetJ-type ribon-helix-helix transcriptional regulator|nr:ribbon-helix-helix domain-containing protein [Candidatus Bathyarchaeia archaeon]